MGAALAWGALSASSLVIGAVLGTTRRWPARWVGMVLAFGAGALISAVSFELVEEGVRAGGAGWAALGLAAGALGYFYADRALNPRDDAEAGGTALALGAFLDGIPEQAVLGISLAEGGAVSVGLVVAIFVSNLPEAIGGATDMRNHYGATLIMRTWIGVALVCTLACVGGYAIADVSGDHFKAVLNGLAAGALLVMLVDSMIPEARDRFGRKAGLVTTLGFAVAAALSGVS